MLCSFSKMFMTFGRMNQFFISLFLLQNDTPLHVHNMFWFLFIFWLLIGVQVLLCSPRSLELWRPGWSSICSHSSASVSWMLALQACTTMHSHIVFIFIHWWTIKFFPLNIHFFINHFSGGVCALSYIKAYINLEIFQNLHLYEKKQNMFPFA